MQFVLGITGGLPASVGNLNFLYETACRQIGEENFIWSVAGAGRHQMQMVRDMAMIMGYDIATSADVRKQLSLKGAEKIVL